MTEYDKYQQSSVTGDLDVDNAESFVVTEIAMNSSGSDADMMNDILKSLILSTYIVSSQVPPPPDHATDVYLNTVP